MKRPLAILALLLLALPASAQLPPSNGISIGNTPIQNGTNGLCLYDANGKVGNQACSTGSVSTFSAGTTGLTPNSATSGDVTLAGTLLGANGGTGVANTGKTITLGGNLTTSGAFASTFTMTNTTAVTFPTSGTLATLDAPVFTTSVGIPSVAWASIPAPGTAGKIVRVSNFGTKGALLMDDGTRWKPVAGCATLATLDAVSSSVGNSETIVFQYLIPIGALQSKDRLRLALTMTKSGTTDLGDIRIRVGTAGTTSDTQIDSWAMIAAANRTGSMLIDFRLDDATHFQELTGNAGANSLRGYSSVSSVAFGASVAISSAASNALYFNVSIFSSSTNDTVALQDAQLQLCSSAN